MHLLRLELVGFKSFCDKISISFAQSGISVVVGPNGCGKSNIVDAIRWCLGEQSAKHLRGSHMQDIIFSGSDRRRATSMARSSLFFSNANPDPDSRYLQFGEIGITRKLYRSGESEYLLNNSPARLTDIRGLFLDTGVGRSKGYAIIEQERITRIVTGSPEERRSIIEEAAGILKFKLKKQEAQKKLETTRQNIQRVEDILAELNEQEESLAKQAAAACRFEECRNAAREIEQGLAALTWEELQQTIKDSTSIFARTKQEIEDAESSGAAQDAQTAVLRFEIQKAELLQEERRSRVEQIKEQIAAEETQQQLYRQAQQNISQWHSKGAETSRTLVAEEAEARAALAQAEDNATEQEGEQAALQQQLSALSSQIKAEQALLSSTEQKRSERKSNLAELRAAQDAAAIEITNLKERLVEYYQQDESAQEQITIHQSATVEQELALRELQVQLSQDREEKELLQDKLDFLSERSEDERESLQELEQRLRQTKTTLATAEAQHKVFEESLESQHDFGEGTATLLEHLAQNPMLGEELGFAYSILDGVSLADSAPPAFGTYLNRKRNLLVFQRKAVFPQIRQLCSELGCGQVGLFFLDDHPPEQHGAREGTERLADYIEGKPPEQLPAAFRRVYLDPQAFSTADPQASTEAEALNAQGDSRLSSGEFVLDTATESGQEANVFTRHNQRKKDLAATAEHIAALQSDLLTWQEEHEEQKERCQDYAAQLDDLTEHKAELDQAINAANASIAVKRNQLDNDQKQIESVEQRKAEFASLSAKAVRRLEKLEQGREAEALERITLEQEITAAEAGYTAQKERVAALQHSQQHLLLSQKDVQNALNSAREKMQLHRKTLDKLSKKQESSGQEVQQRQQEQHALAQKLEQSQQKMKALLSTLKAAQQELSTGKDALEQEKIRLQAREKELGAARQRLEKLRLQGQEHAMLIAQNEQRLQELLERLAENNAAHPEYLLRNLNRQSFQPDAKRAELRLLKASISAMGRVNLAAREEYDKLKERLDFLNGQKNDLKEGIDALINAITHMDRESRKRFRETFEQVNEKFQTLFPLLFEGGSAALELTDESQLLETGVEIMAKPPGKMPKSITLLSGGEKALTAIALIFAVFLIKPSPFCILDEVDAPLDDANIGRFCRLAKELSKTTQLIIITHNRKTMEIADRMFGVTMNEPGVSEVVSVDFQRNVGQNTMDSKDGVKG